MEEEIERRKKQEYRNATLEERAEIDHKERQTKIKQEEDAGKFCARAQHSYAATAGVRHARELEAAKKRELELQSRALPSPPQALAR